MASLDDGRANEILREARQVRLELQEHMGDRVARHRQRIRSAAKTRKSADTRKRIMDAAAQIMLEQGNTAFQMSEISRRCGMSKGALYYYFADKDDLVRAVFDSTIDDLVAGIDAAVAEAETPEQALVAVCHEFAQRASEGCLTPIAIVTELVKSREGTVAREDMRTLYIIRVVADLLEQAKETGTVRPEIDTQLAATSVCGAFTFGALSATAGRETNTEFAEDILGMLAWGVGQKE